MALNFDIATETKKVTRLNFDVSPKPVSQGLGLKPRSLFSGETEPQRGGGGAGWEETKTPLETFKGFVRETAQALSIIPTPTGERGEFWNKLERMNIGEGSKFLEGIKSWQGKMAEKYPYWLEEVPSIQAEDTTTRAFQTVQAISSLGMIGILGANVIQNITQAVQMNKGLKGIENITSNLPKIEKILADKGIVLPKDMSSLNKIKVMAEMTQRSPMLGTILKTASMRAAEAPIPYAVGQMVKFGDQVGKIVNITGKAAQILTAAGQQIPVVLDQLKPIDEPLTTEAKKFKTAEEFIESQAKEIIAPSEIKQAFGDAPQKIRDLIDVRNIRFVDDLGGEGGRYEAKSKTIYIEKGEPVRETIIHETSHNIIEKFSKDDKPFVQAYIKEIFKERPPQVTDNYLSELKKSADDNYVRGLGGYVNTVEERLADDIAQYLINPDKLSESLKTLFSKHFGVTKAQLTDIWEKAQVKPEEATQAQKIEAHRIAREKAFITPEGKTKPQYRSLAKATTGKKSMAEMTEGEASEFITSLKSISEPVYKRGRLLPPSIPRTKALVEPGFFQREFKKPTIAKLVTSQTRYAELLGVKKLVEPMEIGKQELDIEYSTGSHQIDIADKKLKQIKGISSEEMAKTLNIHEEAPATLSEKEKEVFNYYRSLTRDILTRENQVRKTLDLPPIRERKAYFRHIADRMSQEVIDGKYPLPEGIKFWSEQTVGKKVYNPMEMQRKLRDDLLERFSSDLPYVMKSMLWSGLKEIHLSIPKHILNKELGTLTKDKKVYTNLSPQEQKLYDAQTIMPASTKKWLLDYVNIVLGKRQTALDESVNLWITDTPIKTVVNNILRPFGKLVGQKPLTGMLSSFSKLPIYGAMGGLNPRQLIRNKFQTLQNMALYGVKNTIKGYQPISSYPVLQELKTDSLFRKSYSGFEDMPTGTMKKIEKVGLAPYQWTAISNVSQAMNSAYHWTADNIQNPKKAHLGWADPQRTYKEHKNFFYPSEKARLLKEMEYGAHTTQYQYIGLGMPEIFRYKALAPFTRLQSWWMNHWFVFHREAATRAFAGHTGYDTNLRITLGDRLNYLKYLIIGGLILVNLGYYRSYLLGTAPTSMAPTGQLMIGLYDYTTNLGDTDWEKRKRGQAEYKIKEALKIHLPGYLSIKDFTALISGEKDWTEYLFYKKRAAKEEAFRLKGSQRTTAKRKQRLKF